MNSKKVSSNKILLTLAIAIIALVILIAALLIVSQSGGIQKAQNDPAKYIDVAKKYLSAGNTQEAIKAYWSAITVEPKNEQLYVELGGIYEDENDTENAAGVYSLGYQETNSTLLYDLWQSLLKPKDGEDVQSIKTLELNDMTPIFNSSIANNFSQYSFENYENKYGKAEMSKVGDKYIVSFAGANFELVFFNTEEDNDIVDEEGNINKKKRPNEIRLSSANLLFSNITNGIDADKLSEFDMKSVEKKGNEISFTFSGAKYTVQTDADGKITAGSSIVIVPVQIIGEDNEKNILFLSGVILDAVSGEPVENVEVTLVDKNGEFDTVSTTTDTRGAYEFDELPFCEYEITVSCEGYIELKEEKSYEYDGISKDSQQEDLNFTISKNLEDNEIRFVLTWEEYPRDLDAWLVGSDKDGIEHRKMYGNRNDDDWFAALDCDDTDGFGPETMTLRDMEGDYTFAVIDYLGQGGMDQTDVTVDIYQGSEHQTVKIKPGIGIEYGWLVCEIHQGKVSEINGVAQTGAGDLK